MIQFKKESTIKETANHVFSWHERRGALERLSPPWDPVTVIHSSGGINPEAKVHLKMKLGPFSYSWKARHTKYEKNIMFEDIQEKGPFSNWTHTHLFHKESEKSCRMEDSIACSLPFGFITNRFMGWKIKHQLSDIFKYRHRILKEDLEAHKSFANTPKNFLISGASGTIGTALIPFLLTGGHQVKRLVRKRDDNISDTVFWNPETGDIDLAKMEGTDIVIHLAGENIGEGRWTKNKKETIIQSRKKGTGLLVNAMSRLKKKPEVFISASAIGFYGNREQEIMDEESPEGDDFISGVCKLWEDSAKKAKDHGIRTICLRIGVVLTPLGGALKKLLTASDFFMGGVLGSGKQYVSWVDIEDVLSSIYFLISQKELSGHFNLTAPEPVTNRDLVKLISELKGRPAFLKTPEFIIKWVFGQMGKEIVLSSTRAIPNKLLNAGFKFKRPDLKTALKIMLGKA